MALAPDPAGCYTAFYRGEDAAVYQRTFRNGVWSAQTSLGGRIVGAPSAGRVGASLVVGARGTDGILWLRTAVQGSWGPWRSAGGVLSAAPTVVGGADGAIEVFVRGTDNLLWTKSLPPGGTWSRWTSVGGVLASGRLR